MGASFRTWGLYSQRASHLHNLSDSQTPGLPGKGAGRRGVVRPQEEVFGRAELQTLQVFAGLLQCRLPCQHLTVYLKEMGVCIKFFGCLFLRVPVSGWFKGGTKRKATFLTHTRLFPVDFPLNTNSKGYHLQKLPDGKRQLAQAQTIRPISTVATFIGSNSRGAGKPTLTPTGGS